MKKDFENLCHSAIKDSRGQSGPSNPKRIIEHILTGVDHLILVISLCSWWASTAGT